MKEAKDQLIKARCTRTMKEAVAAAAADMPGDNHEESDVVRMAVEEYLARRGYIRTARIAEEPAHYRTVRDLEKAAKKLSGMKKRQAAKKSAA